MNDGSTRPSENQIRVFLLDDHEIVRRGLRDVLWLADDIELVGEAETAAEALAGIDTTLPDVALLDVHLGGESATGIDVCRDAIARHPDLRCLILSGETSDELVRASHEAGAVGYIAKQVRGLDLVGAVRTAASGRHVGGTDAHPVAMGAVHPHAHPGALDVLTERERDVLHLVATGRTNRQIGSELGLTEKTVKNNVTNILAKLGMERRAEAAAFVAALEERAAARWQPGTFGPWPGPREGAASARR